MKLPRIASTSGFTLVELMVTMLIIGIVTAIAYPSYRENIRRGNRAEVRALMLENAQFMERFFSENNSYLQSNAAIPLPPVLPNVASPRNSAGTTRHYIISFRAAPARTITTFAIQAVPVNSMAGDACATLTLNQLGQRGTDGTLTNMTTETCWTK